MSKHFNYLLDDESADFFQKFACDAAESEMPKATDIVKEAAAPMPALEGFEKVAARVDLDISILKEAGETGFSLGMVKRASLYIEKVLDEHPMSEEQFSPWFDKIAAAAIEADLATVRADLEKLADGEYQDFINAEIAAAGIDLVMAANFEKEAIAPLIRAARLLPKALSRGAKGAKGLGFRARLDAVKAAPGRAMRGARAEQAAIQRAKAQSRLTKAEGKFQAAKAKHVPMLQAAARLPGATRQAVMPGVKSRAAAGVGKAKGKLDKATRKVNEAEKRLTQAREATKGPRAPTKDVPAIGKATSQPSAKGSTPRDAVQKSPTKALEEAGSAATKKSPPPIPEDAKKPPGFMEVAQKAMGKGWGSLTPKERIKMIQSGAGAAVGYRALTGHGALTGGEGIV